MALTELERIRLARKVAKDIILQKPVKIEYNKESMSQIVQKYLQHLEDFYNKNFDEMYRQYLEQGEWLIVKLEDGSLELV